jgi:hypothetical protein
VLTAAVEFLYLTWSEDFGDLWVMDVDENQ